MCGCADGRVPASVLDLSFNNIKHVPHSLGHLKSIKTIYFVQNRISHITGFEGVGSTLRSLELGGNKIRVSSAAHLTFNVTCYIALL